MRDLILLVIIIFITFISCQKKEGDMFGQRLPLSKIDYDYYFSAQKHGDVELSVIDLGSVNITSGKVIVCDPLVYLGDTAPMVKKIKIGSYPVKVAIANNTDMGIRYAYVKMVINDLKTVKWELAITEDLKNKIKELKSDEFFGFPVDAGLGCFCDFETQALYDNFVKEFYNKNKDGNIYDDYFASKFKENAINKKDPNDIGDWLNFFLPGTKNNIIMFHSGFGDGYYPVYWGYDEKGNITSLLIDFMIFEYDE